MTVVLGLYFVIPKKYRYLVLLVASITFFAVYSKFMTAFVVATIVSVYFAGIGMNKLDSALAKNLSEHDYEKEERKKLKAKTKKQKKLVAAAAIIFNLAILGVLKYSGFFASIFEGFFSWFNLTVNMPVLKLVLPIGISYYTLSSIGYLVDICRGKYKGDTNFFRVALFVCYFPQLFEGPFAKYDDLAPQLYEGHSFDSGRVGSGFLLVVWGLLKKVVIADRLAIVVGEVFSAHAQYSGVIVALGILFFTFQLYAEFSGLIDMACGISEMFGIKLAKNFQQPFYSQTVSEFWRRWHISLGVWFKDYIFYSISMSKPMMKLNKKLHGKVKPFFELFIPSAIALFVVWFTNGLWHGASWLYVVYGLYYFVLTLIGMCFEPLFALIYKKLKLDPQAMVFKILRIMRTFVLVNIGMLIFRAGTLGNAWSMMMGMFSGGSLAIVGQVIDVWDFVLCFVGILVLIVVDCLKEHNIDPREKIASSNYAIKFAVCLLLILAVLVLGAYGGEYVPPDPIYGGF